MAWPHVTGIRLDERQQELALARCQRVSADALVWDDDVVLERHGLLASIRWSVALRWQIGEDDGLKDNRLLLLVQGEGANQLQSVALLGVEFTQSSIGAAVGDSRLGAPERWRHDDLVLEDKVVQVEVVAVNLPTPRLVHRGRAKDAEKVKPFPKKLPVAGNFPQHLIELHDFARGLETQHAQAHPDQRHRRVSL